MSGKGPAALLVRGMVLGPLLAGLGWVTADVLWPQYSIAIGVGLLLLVIVANAVLLVRARREPDFPARMQEQVQSLKHEPQLGRFGRGIFVVLTLVFGVATVWSGMFLAGAPDFWILGLPLLAGSAFGLVVCGVIAIRGKFVALPGLLP